MADVVDVASVAIAVVVVVVPIVYPVSLSSSSSSSSPSPSRRINEAISVRQVICRSSNLILSSLASRARPPSSQVFRKFGLNYLIMSDIDIPQQDLSPT